MKKVVLITGANGMLAKQVAKQLEGDYTIRFLTRKVTRSNEFLWDLENKTIDPNALKDVHTIVHLAGSSIADKRWTKKRKELILSSRVDSARLILEECKKNDITLDAFISASAVGYYGTATTNNIYTEESENGTDFLSTVCKEWENAAYAFELNGVAKRVAVLRIGIILAKNGGALQKVVRPIKSRIGSAIGTGKQYMPWIHINDLSRLFNFVIVNEELSGNFNAVAPEHATNNELTKGIAKVLHRRLIFPNVPRLIIRALFGEMGEIVLNGSRVSSDKIVSAGFEFKFGELKDALSSVVE
ncbi:MAG: TIGR01777 family oxidoreductase [Crocinitomicaceae bacterium]|nr:TIGR01777 family oxidoreductase [Crocinitomicaceae bacterium]